MLSRAAGPQLRSFIKVLIGLAVLARVLLAGWLWSRFKRPSSGSA